mgnify:CR=1 FL=1
MSLLSLPPKVRFAQPSYPVVITLDAATFIHTRGVFLDVCRNRIAHVEVFPYWVEVALSVALYPEIYNSITVRRYIAYFMTFAMPVINLFYVTSLFFPVVSALFRDVLHSARRDVALRILSSSSNFLMSFLPRPGIPLVRVRVFGCMPVYACVFVSVRVYVRTLKTPTLSRYLQMAGSCR